MDRRSGHEPGRGADDERDPSEELHDADDPGHERGQRDPELREHALEPGVLRCAEELRGAVVHESDAEQ